MSSLFESIIDGTPIIGSFKAGLHLLNGESERAKEVFYKSSRTTASILGGTVGCIVAGPAGAVAGSMYSGLATDTTASLLTKKPHGYIKHSHDVVKDIKRHRIPIKSSLRYGTEFGFDALTGYGISAIDRSDGMGAAVGTQIYNSSVHVTARGTAKKIGKKGVRKTIDYFLDSSDDEDY